MTRRLNTLRKTLHVLHEDLRLPSRRTPHRVSFRHQTFVKMSSEGRVVAFSPTKILRKIICPHSNDEEVVVEEKKTSKFHVSPCKLEMGVKTLAPRTFDQEISLDTYSDPERQLTLAAARVLRDDQAS